MNDVQASSHIRPHPTEPLQEIKITIRLDGISQEFNETFSIEFAHIDFLFAVGGPVTAHSLNGTIIDQDSEFRAVITLIEHCDITIYYRS